MKKSELREIIKEEISAVMAEVAKNRGAVWKTKSGKWGAKNQLGVVRYFKTEQAARAEAKRASRGASKAVGKKNAKSYKRKGNENQIAPPGISAGQLGGSY